MTQAAACVSVATLRVHVVALSRVFSERRPSALGPLEESYRQLLRHLTRAAGCPDIDTLATAMRASDQLLASVEAAHQRRALAGITRIREAFAGVEEFIDQVPLAALGQEPAPDMALDIPIDGLLADLVRKRAPRESGHRAKSVQVEGVATPLKRAA